MDLFIIIGVSLLLVPLVILTSGAFRIVLGLAFVLFFPGYTLIAALFPRKGPLDGIEHLALSFGLSIAVVPLIGLVLNYTPWGVRVESVLISLLIFIIAMAGVALFRRWRLLPQERFKVNFSVNFSRLLGIWRGQGRWDKGLTVLLVLAVVGTAGVLGYIINTPKAEERFTEFYILDIEGEADHYPRELVLGETGQVLLCIVNQEHEPTDYRVEIRIDGQVVGVLGPIALDDKERWEQEAAFEPTRAGPEQKAEFLLYKGGSAEVYLKLHLWIEVKEAVGKPNL